jgi:hypothetical protein
MEILSGSGREAAGCLILTFREHNGQIKFSVSGGKASLMTLPDNL